MGHNFEQAIVDTDDIAAKLQHFYENRDELRALGERCHQFAQQFEWSIACRQFVELLARLPGDAGHWPLQRAGQEAQEAPRMNEC